MRRLGEIKSSVREQFIVYHYACGRQGLASDFSFIDKLFAENMLAVGAGVREPEKTSPRPNGSIENHG
jgi:hypothetical protein